MNVSKGEMVVQEGREGTRSILNFRGLRNKGQLGDGSRYDGT